jgi:hypothetical protein
MLWSAGAVVVEGEEEEYKPAEEAAGERHLAPSHRE